MRNTASVSSAHSIDRDGRFVDLGAIGVQRGVGIGDEQRRAATERLVVGERRSGRREELPLLAVGADQQVDAGGGALGDTAEGIGGHGVTVRHGTEREERQRDAGTGEDSLGLADAFGGHRPVGGEQTRRARRTAARPRRRGRPGRGTPGCRRSPARVCGRPARRLTRAIARWNSPEAAGMANSVDTLMAPADSPKIVTWSGSPPNEAMLSRTHSTAATWSSSPQLPSRRAPDRGRRARGSRTRRGGS